MSAPALPAGADAPPYAPIAVIGMAGRLPGAPDLDAYWRLLREGREGTREIPASRWSIERHYAATETAGKSISKRGGFIDDIEDFDPDYFDIPASDAAEVDPLIRQCLEVGAACFHHAGYAREELAGRAIG
ncbi:beta-ketoacyl synthase N-terminal-like domain-containing protein, partial [Lysobacter sp. 2RAB21]